MRSGRHAVPARPFWEVLTLAEMTLAQWEALCDGCGRCCLQKLRDGETREVFYTSVACRLLDIDSCRCTRYSDRRTIIPACVVLTPDRIARCDWLPRTCAYRLIHEGKPLPAWHPLVSNDPESVHRAGISLRNKAISEVHVDAQHLEPYVIDAPI